MVVILFNFLIKFLFVLIFKVFLVVDIKMRNFDFEFQSLLFMSFYFLVNC